MSACQQVGEQHATDGDHESDHATEPKAYWFVPGVNHTYEAFCIDGPLGVPTIQQSHACTS